MNTNIVGDGFKFKEGDVFFWRYKDDSNMQSPYWCKSRIAVVKGKRLYDTYWSLSADSTQWPFDGVGHLVLEYQGNFADLQPIDSWLVDYYERCDIVNLNHPNSSKGNCYKRKGALRNKACVLELLNRQREEAESDIRSANWKLENLKKTEASILAGDDLEKIYL